MIDPILISNRGILRDSYVLPNFCSDHCPSVIEINFTVPREKCYIKQIWDFENTNYNVVNQRLQDIDWESKLNNENDVNIINERVNDELSKVMNICINKKIVRIRPRDKPWISKEIKCKIRKRNRLHRKAKTRNLASDWENYRKLRNDVIDMIRDAKKNYIINLQNSLVDKTVPPGKWWRIAKNIAKLKNQNISNSPIKVNGDIFFHPVDKANAINNYFSSISTTDESAELPEEPPLSPFGLSEIFVSDQDIIDHFQILNTSKPAGPDNLPQSF